MEQHALLIDDKTLMIEKAWDACRKYNIKLFCVKTVWAAIEELPHKNYVLLIIAADYVNGSLLDVVRLLRSITTIPIQVLSFTYIPETKIAALETGADEYLVVSGEAEEVVISGVALIRRYTAFNNLINLRPRMLGHDGLRIVIEHRKVFVHGREVQLTRKEFDILRFLMVHRQQVMTYGQIFRQAWKEEYNGQLRKTISNHIYR